MSMSKDGTRPLAGQIGQDDDPYGINVAKACREFDAEIAQAVFRYAAAEVQMYSLGDDENGPTMTPDGTQWRWAAPGAQLLEPLPYFSATIAAAWLIVDAMQKRGFVCEITVDCFDDGSSAGVEVRFWQFPRAENDVKFVHASTAPLGICRAAITAVSAAAPGRADD